MHLLHRVPLFVLGLIALFSEFEGSSALLGTARAQGPPPSQILPTDPYDSFTIDEFICPGPRKPPPTGGDPVNLFNGFFEFDHTVFRSAGRGLDVDLTLTYRSKMGFKSPVGAYWDINWAHQKIVMLTVRNSGPYAGPLGGSGTHPNPPGPPPMPDNNGPFGEATLVGLDERTPVVDHDVSGPEIPHSAFYYDGRGGMDYFEPDWNGDGDGTYPSWNTQPGYFSKVRSMPNASPANPFPIPAYFEMRTSDGRIFVFGLLDEASPYNEGRTYWLTEVRDRAGNAITLGYEGSSTTGFVCTSLTDTYGRVVLFGYDSLQRLTSIVDTTGGRTFELGYGGFGNLTTITAPDVAINDPDVPEWDFTLRTTTFGYNQTQNLLRTIIDPGEAKRAAEAGEDPQPYLQNFYNADRQVVRQIWGREEGPGGVYRFYYDAPNAATPGSQPWGPYTYSRRTLVVDPCGKAELSSFTPEGLQPFLHTFTGTLDHALLEDTSTISDLLALNDGASGDPFQGNALNPAKAERTAPIGSSSETCYVKHQTFNGDGLLTGDYGPGYAFEYDYDENGDVFSRANLLKAERFWITGENTPVPPIATSTSLVYAYAYEPLYNLTRAEFDARGFAHDDLPDGPGGPADFMVEYVYDYQERDLRNDLSGLPVDDELRTMIEDWKIDLDQFSMYAALDVLDPAMPSLLANALPSMATAAPLPDQNGDGPTVLGHGNMILRRMPTASEPNDLLAEFQTYTDQVVQTTWTYNDFSLMTSEADAVGNVTEHHYFPESVFHGGDVDSPVAASPAGGGLLAEIHVAAGTPETAASKRRYNPVGALLRTINARGFATDFEYNADNQVVRQTNARGHVTIQIYDVNGNLVERRQSRETVAYDPTSGNPTYPPADTDAAASGWIVDKFSYDLLRSVVEEDLQADRTLMGGAPQAERLRTQYRYDRNNRLVLTLSPSYVEDPSANAGHVISQVWDERGLLYRVTRGGLATLEDGTEFLSLQANEHITDVVAASIAGVTTSETFLYDGRKQLIETQNGEGHSWTKEYDGWARAVASEDPLGNRTESDLNHAGIVVEVRRFENGGVEPLARTYFTVDQIHRAIQTDRFASGGYTSGTLTPGGSFVTSRTRFDAIGREVRSADDNRVERSIQYDHLSRIVREQDFLFPGSAVAHNEREYHYDANDNLIRRVDHDRRDDGVLDGSYVTETYYDELDRKIAVVDNIGRTARFGYDSRHNLVYSSNARSAQQGTVAIGDLDLFGEHDGAGLPASVVNGHGNSTLHIYDDVDRPVATYRALRQGGLGSNAILGGVLTRTNYDANGNLRERIDDSNNTTTYSYDELDRLKSIDCADGTSKTTSYYLDSMVHQSSDANGTTVQNLYDDANRLLHSSALGTLGAGVSPRYEWSSFSYDGLSRIRIARNGRGVSTEETVVTRDYDELSRITRETIAMPSLGLGATEVLTQYDGLGLPRTHTYPSGRVLTKVYDGLNRLQQIKEGAQVLAQYEFMGPGRVWRRRLDEIQSSAMATTAGYDGARRVTSIDHGNSPTAGWSIEWDAASNKTARRRLDDPSNVAVSFEYDSLDRMVHSERPWVGSGAGLTHDYQLDGVGNREVGYVSGVMNEYGEIPGECREYDANGNLVTISDLPSACTDDLAQFSFDYLDRLVQHDDPVTGDTLMLVYDAFGRRVAKGNSALDLTRYAYVSGHVCEEQDASGNVTTFVYGRGVDSVLQMQTDTETYYYLSDDMGNVAELWREGGAADTLVESYDYDDYGQVIDSVSGAALASPSGVGNPYFFTGRRFDSEMGLYYYRARYLDPVAGRFVNRDPIGMWGDEANVGNAYTYAASNPWTRTDPTGLSSSKSNDAFMNLMRMNGSSGGSTSGRGGRRLGRGDGFLTPRGKVGIAAPTGGYANLPKNNPSPKPQCKASAGRSPGAGGGAGGGGCNLPAAMVSDSQEDDGDGETDGGASDPTHGGSGPPDDDDNKASGPGEYKGPTGPPPPGGGARPYVPGPTRPWTGDPESEWQKTLALGTSGEGRAGPKGDPNSIYEQLNDKGKVKSRTFRDGNGHEFARQDFEHEHDGVKPHEHQREFDADGRPISKKTTRALPQGYDTTPTELAARPGHAISGGEVATGVGLYLGYKAVRAVVVSFFATPLAGAGSLALP